MTKSSTHVPQTSSSRTVLRVRVAILAVVLLAGLIYSLVQPLGMSPDEAAHMKYVKFLAAHGRFSVWEADGGGEAGYESQHPPLYYGTAAIIYRAASGLPENWRWQVIRWYSLLIGGVLIWAAFGYALDYFRGRLAHAGVATAGVGMTPLMLEYMSYINPDILSVLWCTIALWMALRIARGEHTRRDLAVLAMAIGLGLLTKLTILGVLPVVITAVALNWMRTPPERREAKRVELLSGVLGVGLIAGWWYVRNSLLYRSPFVHTTGRIGSGLDASALIDPMHLLKLTLTNTYLTTWVERAWLPAGAPGVVFYGLITAVLIAAVALALVGWRESTQHDSAPWLCGLFLVSLFISHQAQVWLVDYEFNAGGRYLLNGMGALHVLVVAALGLSHRRNLLWALWLAVLAFGSILSVHYMLTLLNAQTVPGWNIMHLTVPYK